MRPKVTSWLLISVFCLAFLPLLTFWFRPASATPDPGWSTETVDTGVGFEGYTSIAIDSNDCPHISYHKDLSQTPVTGALCYAHWTGTSWDIQELEFPGGAASTSIAIDSSDHPHISYSRADRLKYAHWTGSSWDIQTVDPAGGFASTSIAIDSSDYPHISYSFADYLKYAHWTGSSWNIQTVDTGVPFPLGCTSIAIDSSDHPHISYTKYEDLGEILPTSTLRYAHWTGSSWATETVAYGGANSIALDSSSHPHISYISVLEYLKYAHWTGSSWDIRTVDNGGGFGGVCELTSIAIDSNDCPHISYYYETPQDLKYAHWNGTSWQTETVDSAGKVGWDTSIAIDSNDCPHISYSDKTNTGIKHAKLVTEDVTDTDGDGMPDTWETQYGLDPNTNDASQDKDGDGYTNLQEYQQGTNPSLASSYPGAPEGENVPEGEGEPSEGVPIIYVVVGVVVIVFVVGLVFALKKR